jgi:two-component system response regulator
MYNRSTMNFEELFNKLPIAIFVSRKDFEYENEKAREIGLKENRDSSCIRFNNSIYKIFHDRILDYDVYLAVEHPDKISDAERLSLYLHFFKEAKEFSFILDRNGRFIDVNPSYEILGFKKDELLGKNSRFIAFEDQIEVLRKNFGKVLKGETVKFTFKAKDAKGEARYLEVLEWPRYLNGEIVGSEGVARDVTESKKLEIELERVNKALKILNQVQKLIFKERDEYSLLRRVYLMMKKFGIEIHAWLMESNKLIEATPGASRCNVKTVEFYYGKCQCGEARNCSLIVPITHEGKILGLIAFCSIGELSEGEISVFSQLGEDLGFAMNHYQVERHKKIMSEILVENLKQFEKLADKLRNPLAIALGYLELEEVSCDEKIKEIEKQLKRIMDTIEDLRFQEVMTFLLTKTSEKKV